MRWTCPLADCAWKTAASLRSRRWKTGDETVSVVRCDATPGDEASQLSAIRRAPSPECSDLLDGRYPCGGGALPSCRSHPASGHVGVLWKRFAGGTVLDPPPLKDEGLHVIWPWDRLFLYDLRLQYFTESYNAISSDGVSLTASVIVRFRLQRDAVPVLHQAIGPNYESVLVQPGIGSLTREVIAQYTAEQV